jgi:hypothetical protein
MECIEGSLRAVHQCSQSDYLLSIMPSQIEQYLEKKRRSIERVDAKAAYEKIKSGEGVIIDTRPESFRAAEGAIPGALIIER